jgi:uncharacterized protein
MKLTQELRLPLSPQDAWAALNDVDVLQACIPGSESLRAISTEEFEVKISVPAGFTDLAFRGRIRLCDVDPPRSYTLRFEDAGGESRAEAHIDLEADGQSETLLRYTANIGLGGWIANFGAPLWDKVARQLADGFFRRFRERVCGP